MINWGIFTRKVLAIMSESALALAGSILAAALVNKIGDAIGWWVAPHQLVRMAKKKL